MAIKITNQQLERLAPSTFHNYIDKLMVHCNTNFPYLQATLGEDILRQTLAECTNKAEAQGYTQRGPVQFYIDMLIILGVDCENDLQYPWIKQTIEKNKHLSQIGQTSELYTAVIEYLEKVAGDQNQYLHNALEKIQRLTLNNLGVERENYIENVHHLLYEIYPEKYEQIPYKNITELIKQGTKKAYYDYGFEEANHATLIILLMFFLGHQFDHDPFYSWASLEKSNIQTEQSVEAKTEKLGARAKIWLMAYLKTEQVPLLTE